MSVRAGASAWGTHSIHGRYRIFDEFATTTGVLCPYVVIWSYVSGLDNSSGTTKRARSCLGYNREHLILICFENRLSAQGSTRRSAAAPQAPDRPTEAQSMSYESTKAGPQAGASTPSQARGCLSVLPLLFQPPDRAQVQTNMRKVWLLHELCGLSLSRRIPTGRSSSPGWSSLAGSEQSLQLQCGQRRNLRSAGNVETSSVETSRIFASVGFRDHGPASSFQRRGNLNGFPSLFVFAIASSTSRLFPMFVSMTTSGALIFGSSARTTTWG